MASAENSMGDIASARAHYLESRAVFVDIQDTMRTLQCDLRIARLELSDKQLDEAERVAVRVVGESRKNEIMTTEVESVELLGESATLVMPARRNLGGSTDMGDLSHLIPACHPYASGAVGPGHSKEYLITDYESAVIAPAKIMDMVVIDLLADGAKRAKEVKSSHRPAMTKRAYIKFQRERAEVVEFDGAV